MEGTGRGGMDGQHQLDRHGIVRPVQQRHPGGIPWACFRVQRLLGQALGGWIRAGPDTESEAWFSPNTWQTRSRQKPPHPRTWRKSFPSWTMPRTPSFSLCSNRGSRDLAQAYAAHVMDVYDHYRWRFTLGKSGDRAWTGLSRDDGWQDKYFSAKSSAAWEMDFWTRGGH